MDGQWAASISGHLHLQVGVMWHCNELGERGSAQDGMVLRLPVHHLELESLIAEIVRLAEDDVQGDFA